jgi:glycosyltransferase involved in cell wall biosynthesis
VKLSLTIITKNEEAAIRRCIESVPFAHEVVVVDSGSTDRTVQICESLGARVVVTKDYPGNGPQKNRALDLATGDWILSLDADEWLTPELQSEIKELIETAPPEVGGYRIKRLSSFCGVFVHHSGWWPDWVVRLVRRGRGRFNDELVHDRMSVEGKLGSTRGHMARGVDGQAQPLLERRRAHAGRPRAPGVAVARDRPRRMGLHPHLCPARRVSGRQGRADHRRIQRRDYLLQVPEAQAAATAATLNPSRMSSR